MSLFDDTLELLELTARTPLPDLLHQDRVTALGKEIGFGALMAAAEYAWRESLKEQNLEGGEFVAGPCRSQVDDLLRRYREKKR